jgi:hypothetical protein
MGSPLAASVQKTATCNRVARTRGGDDEADRERETIEDEEEQKPTTEPKTRRPNDRTTERKARISNLTEEELGLNKLTRRKLLLR